MTENLKKQITNNADAILRKCPHDMRRALWRLFFRYRFERLMRIRYASGTNYTLSKFDQNKCLFVHVPKTGGVSLCRSLFGNLGGGHTKISDYQLIYSQRDFQEYFKFSIVRNPWGRLYSAFNFLKSGGMNDQDKTWAETHLSQYRDFNHFVCDWVCSENIRSEIHFVPQVDFLYSINGKIELDYLGKFENIDGDVIRIANELGIRDVILAHLNKGPGSSSQFLTAFSKDAYRVVENVYGEDIQTFGYTFADV